MSEGAGTIFQDDVPLRGNGDHGDWIAQARLAARRIAAEQGAVTINDVREICPPPTEADPRIMGSVFKTDAFVRVGFQVSSRRSCHGRMIGVFRLRGSA
jgi:hypothetical protein